jgi:hypothetical protein
MIDQGADELSLGLPIIALEETEPAQVRVRNRFECPSPNRKRPRTCLDDSGQCLLGQCPLGQSKTGNALVLVVVLWRKVACCVVTRVVLNV